MQRYAQVSQTLPSELKTHHTARSFFFPSSRKLFLAASSRGRGANLGNPSPYSVISIHGLSGNPYYCRTGAWLRSGCAQLLSEQWHPATPRLSSTNWVEIFDAALSASTLPTARSHLALFPFSGVIFFLLYSSSTKLTSATRARPTWG